MNQNQCIFTILFLSISFHHFIHTVAQSRPPYTPLEHISLDCGSAADATVDGRTWSADTNSTLYSLLDQNTQSTTSSPLVPSTAVDPTPALYTTARLSYSQFTYIFPLTAGPKFLRLYFYPATYSYKPNFNPFTPFFSVTANRYTLLSNFSAALHVQLEKGVYIREFCLFVEDGQSLNLTFTPTHEMPGAYAFINGIEIVSIPNFLYYTSKDDRGVLFVGQGGGNLSPSPLKTSTALELMYRINAASTFIPPEEDTGMFRRWEPDDDFLTDARPGSLLYNTTLHLKYSNNRTRFAAPDLVYQTARGMGPNKTANERYSLTWEFQVDSGFTYLVRLHFCQFNPNMTKQRDVVFQIYINGELVESQADIVNWVGYGVPTFKDYGVTIVAGNGDQKVKNLSIALHPFVGFTGYSDATLNGVEIFKMSQSDNLNATNPDRPFPITPSTSPSPSSTSSKHRNKTGLIIILVGSISGLLALSVLVFLIFRRRRRVKDTGSTSKWGPFTPSSTKSTTGRSSLPSNRCRYFSLSEIRAATRDFDKSFIIGSGGFGNVFKGLIDGDGASTTVAIKRLKPESRQGAKEFETEIEMLSKLRHHNLVSLIGLCNENDEMILVYDYMSRGTFRDHLYNCDNDPLPWKQRLQICIGAAKGLDYLHTGVEHTIIHRDVKTTNILLDEKWVAKVSDFGLSKMGSTSTLNSHVSTAVKGSVGYLDPEYFRRRQITEKSDVYSFGVVLWEVLCAKPAVSHLPGEKPVSLVELARKNYKKGTVDDIIDRYLVGKISPDSLNKFVELAISCLQENGTDRPPMNDVVCFLELALKSQESAEQTTASDEETLLKWSSVGEPEDSDMFSSSNGIAVNSRISGFTNVTSNSDEQSYATLDSAEMRSGAVFSEILKPKGR